MTPVQKILAAALLGAFWLAALVVKHLFPDVDVAAFTYACASGLMGLGIHSASTSGAGGQQGGQGGFARLPMLLLLVVISALGALLAACATPPTPTQANQIRIACAADAGIRPTVDVFLAIPGLAKPEESAAVVAARTVIDQVCKNPDAPFDGGDPYVAVTQATSTVAGILVQLQTRSGAK